MLSKLSSLPRPGWEGGLGNSIPRRVEWSSVHLFFLWVTWIILHLAPQLGPVCLSVWEILIGVKAPDNKALGSMGYTNPSTMIRCSLWRAQIRLQNMFSWVKLCLQFVKRLNEICKLCLSIKLLKVLPCVIDSVNWHWHISQTENSVKLKYVVPSHSNKITDL